MKVGLLELEQERAKIGSELMVAFERVLNSGRFILGEEAEAFESACAEYLGVGHAIGVSSGTDALLISLMALDIGPEDEVLCPAFTFFATAGSVARLGAVPVWVDSDENTFNIDVRDAERKISPNTKAIIPVSLFGQAHDVEGVTALAKAHNLYVVEDFAQSWGAEYKGKKTGTFGNLGATSFFPTKNLGGFGDAGLVTTNDSVLAEKVKSLRNHGSSKRYYHDFIGGNFRIDALQAALLSVKLPHVDTNLKKRRDNAAYYQAKLAELEASGLLILPKEQPNCLHTWNQFTLRILNGKRDSLRTFLAENGIQSEVYYPLPLDQQSCFQSSTRGAETIRVAHTLAEEVLSIPIHPELNRDQQDYIIATIERFSF